MQENNPPFVKNVLLALAEYSNVKGIRGLAEFLEIRENRLYAWIGRNRIGDTGSILAKLPNVRLEWLKTGKGPMLIEGESPLAEYPTYPASMINIDTLTPLQMTWIELGLKMGDLEMLEWLVKIKKGHE